MAEGKVDVQQQESQAEKEHTEMGVADTVEKQEEAQERGGREVTEEVCTTFARARHDRCVVAGPHQARGGRENCPGSVDDAAGRLDARLRRSYKTSLCSRVRNCR
eukprot:117399-Hanusia_phi.AAC.1